MTPQGAPSIIDDRDRAVALCHATRLGSSPRSGSPTHLGTQTRSDPRFRSWPEIGSRSSHPSAQLGDDLWIWSIASGLASVALPWEMRTGSVPEVPTGSLILETSAYEAWLVVWPREALALIASAAETHCLCVVDGELTVSTPSGGRSPERCAAGAGGVLTQSEVIVGATASTATSVHVVLAHQRPLALPWQHSA